MLRKPTVGSLFAGIGGFDLGFERAGFEIRWQVEIDSFCQAVLKKHWPDVKRYSDVREVGAELERVDVICGGFPCQPVSVAGKRLAQADDRWLWPEFARIIRTVRPRFVVVENVPGLLIHGMGDVLRDLALIGFDAEWQVLSAAQFGAPHLRRRVWLVAYTSGERAGAIQQPRQLCGAVESCEDVADTDEQGLQERLVFTRVPGEARCDDDGQDSALGGWWDVEPDVGRVAHGVSNRVDRLKGLGNSVVPHITEWIARQIKPHLEG